jgi:hypothetical protein
MHPIPQKTRPVDEVLSSINAKLEVWQVRALFLGANASTNVRLGPQHLLEHICGPEPVFGNDVDDANANLHSLMALWNQLVADHRTGHIQLSEVRTSNPPERGELEAFAKRRQEEITWFTRGVDAGGDDPIEFGPDGEQLFRRLAEAAAFLEAQQKLLGELPEQDFTKARRALDQLTGAIETIIDDLLTVGDGIRRQAIAEYQQNAGRRTDDGVPVRRPVKVGRNQPCPCGSGRKWKRCCGSPTSMQ